jgi:cardiolipin synthase (CMP-forming)
MNLPNLLSLFRLFLTLFFILLAANGHFRLALLLFVLQAVSDMLDGFFARRMGAKTNLGAYLDPLADKVMLASSYIVLCFKSVVPLWLVLIVLARDLLISLGYLILLKRGLKTSPVPSFISKTTTVFQMLTIVYVLWSFERGLDFFFYWATAFLTVASGLQYIVAGWTVFFRKETV